MKGYEKKGMSAQALREMEWEAAFEEWQEKLESRRAALKSLIGMAGGLFSAKRKAGAKTRLSAVPPEARRAEGAEARQTISRNANGKPGSTPAA